MSMASSIAYANAAAQVIAKMNELQNRDDRWRLLKEWADKELRHDE